LLLQGYPERLQDFMRRLYGIYSVSIFRFVVPWSCKLISFFVQPLMNYIIKFNLQIITFKSLKSYLKSYPFLKIMKIRNNSLIRVQEESSIIGVLPETPSYRRPQPLPYRRPWHFQRRPQIFHRRPPKK